MGHEIGMAPSGFERFCWYLKKDSLKTYVRHRLDGDDAVTAVLRMTTSMRDTDLFDNEELYRESGIIRPKYQ